MMAALNQRKCPHLFRSRWERGTKWAFSLILFWATSAHAVINILDHGAVKDGSATSTEAFRKAIAAATQAGGGTVYVPPGTYVTGPIELASNLVLHIDAGATIRFPAQRLPYADGRVQGIECLQPIPLIGGTKLENVTIIGKGTITTDNAEWVQLMGAPIPASANSGGSAFGQPWNDLLAALQKQTPQPREMYLSAAPLLRPALIRFMECKNVTVEGIRIVGSSFWTIQMLYSERILIRDARLETFPGIFSGGIYIDSSRDVQITNCFLDNGDDAITLKAGKDADGLRVNRPTENVSISNCIIHRGSGAIVLGSETSGGIRNVIATNILCKGTQYGINIKSKRGRGGVIENIRIDNMTMEDVGIPISISTFFQMQGDMGLADEPVSVRTPRLRNIDISRITIDKSRGYPDFSWNPITAGDAAPPPPVTILIEGLPEVPIANLRISDVVATAKAGLKASHADGMELRNIRLNAESGPAFLIRDLKDPLLDNVGSTRPLATAPVIRMERASGGILRNSRASEGTDKFLSMPPGELNSIVQQANSIGAAKVVEEPSR